MKKSENVGAYSAEKKVVRKSTFPPQNLRQKR